MRLVLVGVVSTLAFSVAHADDTHYATPLLGDRPSGMGSAATGVASETSTTYYNPAGLTRMQRTSFSGGLWLRAFEHYEIHDALRSGEESTDLSDNTNPGVPGFVAASLPLGRRHENGERSVVLALSTFQLYGDRHQAELDLATPGVRDDSVTTEVRDRATVSGLSVAWLAPWKLSFGASLFLERRRIHQDEQTTSLVLGNDTIGPPYDNAFLGQGEYRLDVNSYHFLFRLGVHRRATSRFAWGLMFQPPGIKLKSTAEVRALVATNDATVTPAQATYTIAEKSGIPAYLPIPFEIRFGFAYRFSERVLFAADGSLVGPVQNKSLVSIPLPFVASIGGTSTFIANSRERRPVFNLALGTEIAPVRRLVVRLGFFTDFSAAPTVPSVSNVFLPPKINLYGFSTSVGLRTFGRDNYGRGFSVGFIVSFGRGDALAANLGSATDSYVRTTAIERTFFITLTGALATAQQLSTQVGYRREPQPSESTTQESRANPPNPHATTPSAESTTPNPRTPARNDESPTPR